tara:strand:- start:515 stop:745 length:231 start_codon:yes stop_codon:yes gene_type:complete
VGIKGALTALLLKAKELEGVRKTSPQFFWSPTMIGFTGNAIIIGIMPVPISWLPHARWCKANHSGEVTVRCSSVVP